MDKLKNNIRKIISSINQYNLTVFRDELGDLSLVRYKGDFVEITSAGENILEKFNRVSSQTSSDFANLLADIDNYFADIDEYSPQVFIDKHESIIEKFDIFYDRFLDLKPFLNLPPTVTIEEIEKLKRLNKQLADASDLKIMLSDEVKKLELKIETIDERYSSVIPKVELLNQKEIFKKSADSNLYTAIFWLVVIIITGFSLYCLFENILKEFCFEASCFNETKLVNFNKICIDCGQQVLWLEIIKALLFRFLIISLGIYALTFAVRNFNTAMHNRTVNKHKQNSFEAALILIEQTSAEGKDSIVSLAAQSIFTQQKTGYLGKENDALNASIIEQILNRGK